MQIQTISNEIGNRGKGKDNAIRLVYVGLVLSVMFRDWWFSSSFSPVICLGILHLNLILLLLEETETEPGLNLFCPSQTGDCTVYCTWGSDLCILYAGDVGPFSVVQFTDGSWTGRVPSFVQSFVGIWDLDGIGIWVWDWLGFWDWVGVGNPDGNGKWEWDFDWDWDVQD